MLRPLLLLPFFLVYPIFIVNTFAQSTPYFDARDSIDLEALKTYNKTDLDRIVNAYYNQLDVQDTFDLFGFVDQITMGDHYRTINFDSLIQNMDWTKVMTHVDWNKAFSGIDWNKMTDAMCQTPDSMDGESMVQFDIPEGENLQMFDLFSPEKMMNCAGAPNDMGTMMRAIDLPCFMSKMTNNMQNGSQNGGGISDIMKMLEGKQSMESIPDLGFFCQLKECLNMNVLYENLDWNCVYKDVDISSIMKNWRVDDVFESMDTVLLSRTDSTLMDKFQSHPLLKLMNPDTIANYMEVAFKDFFDPQSLMTMNQNFYDRTIGDNWQPNDKKKLLSLLQFSTPLLPRIFDDTVTVRYFSSKLWLSYEMQEAVSQLDYTTALSKQLLIKDIIIKMIQENLFEKLLENTSTPFVQSQDFAWALMASSEQIIGQCYAELGQHTLALSHYKNALHINKSFSGDIDPIEVEQTYLNPTFPLQQLDSLLNAHQIDTAVFYLSLDQMHAGQHPKFISKLMDSEKYDQAIIAYELLKDLLLEVGQKHEVISRYQNPNPAASKPYEFIYLQLIYKKMVEVYEKGNLFDDPRYSTICAAEPALKHYLNYQTTTLLYNNLGAYHLQLNDLELSRDYLSEAWDRIKGLKRTNYIISTRPGLGSIETAHLKNVPTAINIISNLAVAFFTRKEYDQASDFLDEAMRELKSMGMSEATQYDIYALRGQFDLLRNDPQEAWKSLVKCKSIGEVSPYPIRQIQTAMYLGQYYWKLENIDSTLHYWKQAEGIAQRVEYTNLLSTIHNQLGQLYQFKQNTKLAIKHYKDCERLATPLSLYRILRSNHTALGILYFQQKDYDLALHHFGKSISIVEDSLFHHTLGELSRGTMIENNFSAYEGAIVSALELKQYDKAFTHMQSAKSRTLDDLLATAILESDKIPADLQKQKQDVKASLDINQRYLMSGIATPKIKREQKELLQEMDIIDAKIRKAVPKMAPLLDPETIPLATIQQQLTKEQAIVDYFVGNEVMAFVITPDTFSVFSLGNSATLQKGIAFFKTGFDTLYQLTLKNNVEAKRLLRNHMFTANQRISQQLFKPIYTSGILKNCKELIIAPDHQLYLLPFEIWPDSIENDSKKIIQKRTISYIQSASTFAQLHQKTKPNPTYSKPLLVLGKSDFSYYPKSELVNLQEVNRSIFSDFTANAHFLIEQKATYPDLVQALQSNRYRYIYLSTHAIIHPTSPKLSSLALTDSQLPLYKIIDLPLDSELVILSACQTAKGTFQRGTGIKGFTRALMAAGTKSVIISLWPVEDEVTEVFFKHFFHFLSKKYTPAEALQRSKLEMMSSSEYNHPFDWASFVLFG